MVSGYLSINSYLISSLSHSTVIALSKSFEASKWVREAFPHAPCQPISGVSWRHWATQCSLRCFKIRFYCWVWCQRQSEKLKKRKENRQSALKLSHWPHTRWRGTLLVHKDHAARRNVSSHAFTISLQMSGHTIEQILCTDLENCCHFIIASDESRDIQDQPQLAAFFMHSESEEEYYLKCSEGRVAGHSCPWGTRHVGPFSKRLYWWLLEEATHWINKSKKIALKLFIAWPHSHWYLRYFCEFCLCSSLNWSCFCCGCLSCSRQWCPEYIPHH